MSSENSTNKKHLNKTGKQNWEKRKTEFFDFYREKGRKPSQHRNPTETSIYKWAYNRLIGGDEERFERFKLEFKEEFNIDFETVWFKKEWEENATEKDAQNTAPNTGCRTYKERKTEFFYFYRKKGRKPSQHRNPTETSISGLKKCNFGKFSGTFRGGA